MKTASQSLKDARIPLDNWEGAKLLVIKAMIDFAEQACKEQREICADTWIHSDVESYETILNAPQPQLL